MLSKTVSLRPRERDKVRIVKSVHDLRDMLTFTELRRSFGDSELLVLNIHDDRLSFRVNHGLMSKFYPIHLFEVTQRPSSS